MPQSAIGKFIKMEAAGGIVLVFAAILALIVANTPLSTLYREFFETRVGFVFGSFELNKQLLLWVNDGLMAIFFLLVGLELKREFFQGQLSDRSQLVLPLIAALGGFVVPAAIYVAVNFSQGDAFNGWAIPAATDIAFALGVLSLLGKRVPLSLKVFLASIAVIDDLAAIVVIGIFYSGDLSTMALAIAALCCAALFAMNRLGVVKFAPYIIVGMVMWVFVLKSGVHATLAGVLLAFAIPLTSPDDGTQAPLVRMEHGLHTWVAFAILPLFAFANAGVSLTGASISSMFNSVSLGIILGLVFGKQIGVFGSVLLATRLGLANLPAGTTWMQVYGVSVLTGIGFTMSLFIGSLAFEHGQFEYFDSTRIGVLVASFICAVVGFTTLWLFRFNQS